MSKILNIKEENIKKKIQQDESIVQVLCPVCLETASFKKVDSSTPEENPIIGEDFCKDCNEFVESGGYIIVGTIKNEETQKEMRTGEIVFVDAEEMQKIINPNDPPDMSVHIFSMESDLIKQIFIGDDNENHE